MDLYSRFGIRVIMGNFLGAYTKGSNADWQSGTDYSDKTHRQNMKDSVRKMVEEFKDEPYILMWMLGNENDSVGMDGNSTVTKTNAPKNPKAYAQFVEEICQMIKRHAKGLCEIKGEFTGIREMRKHFAWYTAGIKHAAALRNEANQVTNLEQFDGLVDMILEGLH